MCKKVTLGVLGVLLVGGVLFGSKGLNYLSTAVHKVRAAAEDSVPISFQIDAAKNQLAKIKPEIHSMVHQIAKEKAQIKRLKTEMLAQKDTMQTRYNQMMALRSHLDSGEDFYVATNGQAYTNTRVKEDLANRFSVYKTAKETLEKSEQIYELRNQAMETAITKLEQAKALERELQVQIENLNARQRMVEVAEQASSINIDDSELSRTKEMIDDITAKIETREEMMNLAPKYLGAIPVGEEIETGDRDILKEMDAYFGRTDDTSEVVNN